MTAFKVVHADGLVEHVDPEAGTVTASVQLPSRVQAGMSCAGAEDLPSIHHLSDRALARVVMVQRRAVEDAEFNGNSRRAVIERKDLRVLVALQHVRFRLRCRYGARDAYGPAGDQGTDVYDHWYRFGQPPSYALAFSLDRARFDAGRPSVVAWKEAS